MQITELDKLQSDLQLLIFTRQKLGEIRNAAGGRRLTATMIRMRISRMICLIDAKIGNKKHEIASEEIRMRLGETGGGGIDQGTLSGDREDDGTADDRNDPGDDGRDAQGREQGRDGHAGGESRARKEPGRMDPVQRMAARKNPGSGNAEEILRQRHRERHPEMELKDWQRDIMERDRAGKHEERITI